ncbi:hypothetical protein [Pseudoxanthomonas beigongshangi]
MPAAGPIIGAVGSLAGGAMGANAAGNAANAQTQASRDAIAAQIAMYNQNRADTMPYQATGVGALNLLAQMYGLPSQAFSGGGGITMTGGEAAPKKKRSLFDKFTDPANLAGQFGGTSYDPMGFFGKPGQSTTPMQFNFGGGGGAGGTGSVTPGTGVADFSQFYKTPDYLVAMQEGIQGLDRGAAARGRLYSGGADADRMRLASNIGSNSFSNFQNNLFRLAGFGGQANSQLNQLGQTASGRIGGALQDAGAARASGYINQANAWGNAFNNAGGFMSDFLGQRNGMR